VKEKVARASDERRRVYCVKKNHKQTNERGKKRNRTKRTNMLKMTNIIKKVDRQSDR
jgi:hypothetical protein